MSHNLQQTVIEKVELCYLHAEKVLKCSFTRPTIQFNQGGKSAGSARLQHNELRFNPTLLQENHAHFIQQTVPHEVAHLITFQLYGRVKPHGKEWKNIMLGIFNLAPDTTHNYDVNNVIGKTFTYHCQCSTHQLTIRRHNKVLRQQSNYFCRHCKQTLISST